MEIFLKLFQHIIRLPALCILLLLFSCDEIVEFNREGISSIDINGTARLFYIKLPDNYSEIKKYPLMFFLHPAGSTGFEVLKRGYTESAHKRDFIIIYPVALNGSWKLYNDLGNKCSDVIFISKLIKECIREFSIDTKRIYSAGMSLGGFMSLKLHYDLPDQFAAISVISGTMYTDDAELPLKPISIQHIHALNDRGIPYISETDQLFSIPDSIKYWNMVNGLESSPELFIDTDLTTGERWCSENLSYTTELITHKTGGHSPFKSSPEYVLDFFNRK